MQSDFGQYTIDSVLSPGRTFLARDGSGRRVVLKKLDDDCLLNGQLHPNIRERLARIRDLSITQIAALLGVERFASGAYLVWDYVDAKSIEESVDLDRDRLAGDLLIAVEAVHARGLVHGSIHERNVFVDVTGRVILADASPLLHHDPARDLAGIAAMGLERIEPVFLSSPGDSDSPPFRKRALIAALVTLAVAVLFSLFVIWMSRRAASPGLPSLS